MSCYLRKGAAESLDYQFDWRMLGADTISTSEWSADTGIDIGINSHSDTTTTVWLSGGVAGRVYQVVNKITTANARIAHQSLTVRVA